MLKAATTCRAVVYLTYCARAYDADKSQAPILMVQTSLAISEVKEEAMQRPRVGLPLPIRYRSNMHSWYPSYPLGCLVGSCMFEEMVVAAPIAHPYRIVKFLVWAKQGQKSPSVLSPIPPTRFVVHPIETPVPQERCMPKVG